MDTTPLEACDPTREPAAPFDEPIAAGGRIHSVTAWTFRREAIFVDFDLASRVGAVLGDDRLWRGGRLLAWVLLPHRLHLLLELGEHDTVATAIGRFKSVSSTRVRAAGARISPLWSRGYASHALAEEERPVDVARELVAMPLRHELAQRIGDYPYWNALWLRAG